MKLANLQDLVEAHNAEAACRQKSHYNKTFSERHFVASDIVWLSIPTAGKLDRHWDGRWHIKLVKSPLTVEITDGEKTKIVHVNRVRHRQVPNDTPSNHLSHQGTYPSWESPLRNTHNHTSTSKCHKGMMIENCLINHKTSQTSKSCQGGTLTKLDTHLKDMAWAAARDELQTEGGRM